jgi:hypothetical protein
VVAGLQLICTLTAIVVRALAFGTPFKILRRCSFSDQVCATAAETAASWRCGQQCAASSLVSRFAAVLADFRRLLAHFVPALRLRVLAVAFVSCPERGNLVRDSLVSNRVPRLESFDRGAVGIATTVETETPAAVPKRIDAKPIEAKRVQRYAGAFRSTPMCDYSMVASNTRQAKIDDKLTVRWFGWSTKGFAASENASVAVCLLPGTELSFADEVSKEGLFPWTKSIVRYRTAIFRKVNLDRPSVYHDALEFPDGQIVLLTFLKQGQQATVLQLPVCGAGVKASREAAEA